MSLILAFTGLILSFKYLPAINFGVFSQGIHMPAST